MWIRLHVRQKLSVCLAAKHAYDAKPDNVSMDRHSRNSKGTWRQIKMGGSPR